MSNPRKTVLAVAAAFVALSLAACGDQPPTGVVVTPVPYTPPPVSTPTPTPTPTPTATTRPKSAAKERKYVAALKRVNPELTTPEVVDTTVQWGYTVCAAMDNGWSMKEVTDEMNRRLVDTGTVEQEAVWGMVISATMHLCPEHKP